MAKDSRESKDQKKPGEGGPRFALGRDGGSRTDYDLYDWSGKQVDDYKDVRRKGSDR